MPIDQVLFLKPNFVDNSRLLLFNSVHKIG